VAAVNAPLDLDAIRTRADAATVGPWREEHGRIYAPDAVTTPHDDGSIPSLAMVWGLGPSKYATAPTGCISSGTEEANREFIAHAREDVPALLSALEATGAALRAVTDHMDRAGGDRYGDPECPWCLAQHDDDDAHNADCELLKARAALALVAASEARR
jgi:hypothetical protein